jgi:hypothetical protein
MNAAIRSTYMVVRTAVGQRKTGVKTNYPMFVAH